MSYLPLERQETKRGANVASGSTVTLGYDGNTFLVTGTTDIDYITTAGWEVGERTRLFFNGTLTINHNTATPPGGTASILLMNGALYATFQVHNNYWIELEYTGSNWLETQRTNQSIMTMGGTVSATDLVGCVSYQMIIGAVSGGGSLNVFYDPTASTYDLHIPPLQSDSMLIVPNIGILSTTSSIDGTTIATTDLYTVPTSRIAVITGAVVRLVSTTGYVSVGTAGIGIAAGEADIFPAIVLTGLDGSAKAITLINSSIVTRTGAAGDVIKLGIDVGYVATTAVLAVDLLGYLLLT